MSENMNMRWEEHIYGYQSICQAHLDNGIDYESSFVEHNGTAVKENARIRTLLPDNAY